MTDIESRLGAVKVNDLASLINAMRLAIRELQQRVAKLESKSDPPKLHGVEEIVVDLRSDGLEWVHSNSSGFAKRCETLRLAVIDVVRRLEQQWDIHRVSITMIGGKTKGRHDVIKSPDGWTDGVECHHAIDNAIVELMARHDPSNYRLTFTVDSFMRSLKVGGR